jgi:hypothetical protein
MCGQAALLISRRHADRWLQYYASPVDRPLTGHSYSAM